MSVDSDRRWSERDRGEGALARDASPAALVEVKHRRRRPRVGESGSAQPAIGACHDQSGRREVMVAFDGVPVAPSWGASPADGCVKRSIAARPLLRSRIRHSRVRSTPMKRLHHVRPALFSDADTIRVHCGRCVQELLVRIEDIRGKRIIDCEVCRPNVAHERDER